MNRSTCVHSRRPAGLARAAFALLLSAAFPPTSAAGPDLVPVVSVEGMGGQFFFQGENTSFSGNAAWQATPGLKFSKRFSLLPTASGRYQRTREVQELIGGGFLTRENLENTATLKGILALNDSWKLKLKGSARSQLLVESDDEDLGKGLFDNVIVGMGLEAERSGKRLRSLRFSLDPYAVRFPHYNSLASGSSFGSEIDSGENTLDFNAYDATAAADLGLGKSAFASAMLLGSYRLFTDQKIVTDSGLFTDSKRKDWYGAAALGLARVLPEWSALGLRTLVGFDATASLLDSDQSNYDASRNRFNPDYYDYLELGIAPKVLGRFKKGVEWSLVYGFMRRTYSDRPVQSADGNYLADPIRLDTHTVSGSVKVPLAKGFAAVARGAWRRATSNMQFEQTYRYNYHSEHYFTGISWDY